MTTNEDKKKGWTAEDLTKFMNEDVNIEKILPQIQKKLNLTQELKLSKKQFEGLTNMNKLLETSDQKFFLRIKTKPGNTPYATPEREFRILKLFQENNLNISPKVYLFDDSCELIPQTYQVMEYIDGEVSNKVDYRLVAKCLKQLHSIDYSKLKGEDAKLLNIGNELPISDEHLIPVYYQIIEDWILKTGIEMLDEEVSKKLTEIYHKIIEISSGLLHLRKNLPRNTIIHRDVHNLNFIKPDGKNELMLVDWEMVHLNHYLFDICYYTIYLNDEEEKEFFEIYGLDEKPEIVWLQYMEQLLCSVGFFINIYQVAKTQNLKLPNIGDQYEIKTKLDGLIEKLHSKFKTYE
eukprot:gene10075-2496_t